MGYRLPVDEENRYFLVVRHVPSRLNSVSDAENGRDLCGLLLDDVACHGEGVTQARAVHPAANAVVAVGHGDCHAERAGELDVGELGRVVEALADVPILAGEDGADGHHDGLLDGLVVHRPDCLFELFVGVAAAVVKEVIGVLGAVDGFGVDGCGVLRVHFRLPFQSSSR